MAPRRRMTYSSRPNHAARAAHARAQKEFKTYDVSYIAPKRSKVPIVVAIVAAIVVIALVLGLSGALNGCSRQETVAEGTEVTVTVPEGASTPDIAELLYDAELIGNEREFISAVSSQDASTSLLPGTYTFTGGTSVDDLVAQLMEGPQTDTLAIPEGSTASEVAQAVDDATSGRVSADEVEKLVADASAYEDDYDFVADAYDNSLEGFLFPKTYALEGDATADDIIRMMLDQYEQEVSSLDYSYAEEQGLSEYDVLILASIIEKESAADNRATVSSVFYNRLAEGMYLQSDATVAYVVGDDPTADDLSVDSPYNTYLYEGLPPGSICSPGLDCLEAACAPEDTDYLYFYFAEDSNGEMQYYFSKTYKQHQAAIEKAAES